MVTLGTVSQRLPPPLDENVFSSIPTRYTHGWQFHELYPKGLGIMGRLRAVPGVQDGKVIASDVPIFP